MKSGSTAFYHIVAFVTVAIWGSTFVFTKLLLLNGLSPAQIFTLRFIIAYVLLLGYSLVRRRKVHQWVADSWRDELIMLALGVTGGSVYFLAENEALNYTATTNVSLIVCSCPLMAVCGLIAVVLNGHFMLHLSPVGDALAAIACACWAVYSVLMIPANKHYKALFITRKVFFYGLLTMIPYFILHPEWPPLETLLRPQVVANLLFLGVIASCLCFLVWTWVMDKLGAFIATNYVYVNPVSTIVFASLVLSEQITIFFLLGTALILTGMYLADKR